ncbi:hypothetical protein ZIOFF_004358 [Zingiber officinale]|uniref:Uncharacterized protein n=1 Tax=Zingiber officinale TaxID=94328 RepID=A0A8J5MB70_ZINOF|nr:hypothetical protein ZIOFF_004358 [Zingiber officinale]
MPCLNLFTNVRLEEVDTSTVLSETTKAISDIIGKPETPAAYGELVSIGGLNSDVNKKLSAGIADILENNMQIKHKNMLSVCMPCINNKSRLL